MTQETYPSWDLSDLYSSLEDSKINSDLQEYKTLCQQLSDTYKGKLKTLTAEAFLKSLQLVEKIKVISSRLGEYAFLNMSTQMDNKKATAFYQNISEQLTEYGKPSLFFSLELNQVPENILSSWMQEDKVAFYRPYLERIQRIRPFQLTEPEEEVFFEKEITSSSAWVRLYEETSSRLRYLFDGQEYNDAEIRKFLLDKNPETRAKAGKEINRVSKENAPLFSFIYNMIVKDKAIEDEKRGFKTPISSRNLSENVSDESVKVLAETVQEHYQKIAGRFYRLKAKWLGVEKIQYWDRNAPLPFSSDEHIPWEKAVEMVLEGYREFSPKLNKIAQDFFDKPWVDVPPKKGKRSGAFCASATASMHPYLMLNYQGKYNDVLTLAHELGHGCHHQLRTQNGDLNERSRMTSEEVGSVFGEMITFQSLVKKASSDKERLCLIADKVSDMINTALRQIGFHFFETRVHDERKKGELSEERLAEIWVEEMKKYLGNEVIVDEDSAYIWSQVGHFFYLPFYVYAYSYADCLVNSLYQVSQEGKVSDFSDKYLTMLSKTAIEEYDVLLKPFGLNPNEGEFWHKGLALISHYIDELERLDKIVFG